MNGRIVLFNLTSSFLVLALVTAASAQTRTVGVDINNKFRYSITASWSSTDPTATPPSYIVDYNDTQWLEVFIAGFSGTNVTGQVTKHYKNGAETTVGGWIDVDTGDNSNMTFLIISANLSASDSLYTLAYATWFLNETVPKTYLSGARDTNHLNLTSLFEVQYLVSNMYWDKLTGILVDQSVENTYETGPYTTSWSMEMQIISSDLWVVPEFSTWIAALLMLIALTSAMIIIFRPKSAHWRA